MSLPLQSFKVSEPIKAGMVVAYNHHFPANEPRVNRALGDDDIVGVAVHDSDVNDMVTISPLIPGIPVKVLAGAEFGAGDLIGLKPIDASAAEAGYVYPIDQTIAVAIKLVAMEHANEGELLQAVGYTCPSIAPMAYALDTDGNYVGGPDKHMYFLPTGIPVNSSANVGNDSTPIYMAAGKFKACTSAGGGAGEYVASDTIHSANKSGDIGTTDGAKVHYYWAMGNNDITLSMPDGQTQPMLIQGVITDIAGAPTGVVALPVPFCKKVAPGANATISLKPYYASCTSFKFECTLTKA